MSYLLLDPDEIQRVGELTALTILKYSLPTKLIGIGNSGLIGLIAAQQALWEKDIYCHIAIMRKEGFYSNSHGDEIEQDGFWSGQVTIVDDFAQSGDTVRGLIKRLNKPASAKRFTVHSIIFYENTTDVRDIHSQEVANSTGLSVFAINKHEKTVKIYTPYGARVKKEPESYKLIQEQ